MGSEARNDVCISCRGREGRNVKRALVHGVYTLDIWEAGGDGLVGWGHVGHGSSSCEKVTCCARVIDGGWPMLSRQPC